MRRTSLKKFSLDRNSVLWRLTKKVAQKVNFFEKSKKIEKFEKNRKNPIFKKITSWAELFVRRHIIEFLSYECRIDFIATGIS